LSREIDPSTSKEYIPHQMVDPLRRGTDKLLQSAVLCLAGIIVVARFIPLLKSMQGDFPLHYGLAMRLVAGEFLYWPGFDRVYPPFWALVHAPFTFFDVRRGEMALYPLGVASIVGLVLLLRNLADRHWPLSQSAMFWSGTLAILLASPFLQRDLVELGVNTFIVLLTWLGIYLWTRNEDAYASIPLGIAAALKCTPVAFILYFFWKRQWKIAIGASVVTLFFTLLPVAVMGTRQFVHSESFWLNDVLQGMSDPDPSRTVMGPDRVGNLSLRTALARYLIHLPYGNPGRPETPVDSMIPDRPPEPLYFDVVTLAPATAGRIVKLVLLLIAAGTAWMFRHGVRDRNDPQILWECAALSVAILLYSPLTWAQHCPAVLPALYFIFRAAFAGERLPRFVPGVLVIFFLMICVFQRGLVGLRLAGLMDAYHLRNFTLLALFWAVLRCHGLPGRVDRRYDLSPQ